MLLIVCAVAQAADGATTARERTRIRTAVEGAWKAHIAERVARANLRYPNDPITLMAGIGRLRVGKDKVWFEGRTWAWEPHPIEDGRARAFVWRRDLDRHLASGGSTPLQIRFGGRPLETILRWPSLRGRDNVWKHVWSLANPEEIDAFTTSRHAIDPLTRPLLRRLFVSKMARSRAEAWWWLSWLALPR